MLSTLASVGCEIVDVPLPDEFNLLTGTFNNVRLPERTEPFLEYLRTDLKLFGVSLNSFCDPSATFRDRPRHPCLGARESAYGSDCLWA